MLRPKPALVVLLLLAFVFARLTGAHLHLCFDGSEPPVQFHTADSAHVDHHFGEAQSHDDVDIDPLSDVLAKSGKLDLPVLALLVALLILFLAPIGALAIARRAASPPRPPPRFFLPPLRAPPV